MKIVRSASFLVSCALIAWCAVSLMGCSANMPRSGFLTRYDLLEKYPDSKADWSWLKQGVEWDRYPSVMIDPVTIMIDKDKDNTWTATEVTPEEKEELAMRFRDKLTEAMKGGYPVTDKSGPGVLRCQIALTHLKPVNPALNVTAAVVVGWPLDAGGAVLEARFKDAQTGEVLAEWASVKNGSVMDITAVWTRWGQVDEAFETWAKFVRTGVDEVMKEYREEKARTAQK
jgi:hypothetical protein